MKDFKKSDLKTGMRVHLRRGDIRIVFLNTIKGDVIVSKDGYHHNLEHYDEDLKEYTRNELDVVKVYEVPYNNKLVELDYQGFLIWQEPTSVSVDNLIEGNVYKMHNDNDEYVLDAKFDGFYGKRGGEYMCFTAVSKYYVSPSGGRKWCINRDECSWIFYND